MKPLEELTREEARSIEGLVFDLDDTVLDHGALSEAAYSALFRLKEAGVALVASTGRPAGWAEVVARQWPIDLAVAENGAVVVAKGESAKAERREDRARLVALAEELVARFPSAALADDNDARRTDVTIDIGERRRVAREEIDAMRAIAGARGVRTSASSVHLHLTFDAADKASGTIVAIARRFAIDATRARFTFAFAGDSGNDAAAFAAFRLTFGVANVRRHLAALTVPPRFVAKSEMGRGFAEIALTLRSLRRS